MKSTLSSTEPISFPLRLPTRQEEERQRRFKVLRNYLMGLDAFLRATYGEDILPGVLTAQRQLHGFTRIQRKPVVNPDAVRRALTLSWAAELQLRLAPRSQLCYSNAWAPVHSYYAICMALNAWFGASFLNPPTDHAGTLNTISAKTTHTSILPLPWAVTCAGCPPFDCNYPGLPTDANPDQTFQLLANPSPSDFWPRYCKLLKKTREFQLDRAYRDWKQRQHRHKMHKAEKQEVALGQPAVTAFHYLYRLRLRANYRDVETMLMSSVDNEWHARFYNGLLALTDASCLLVESLLIRSSGSQIYLSTMDDFFSQTPTFDPDPRSFLVLRRRLLTNK